MNDSKIWRTKDGKRIYISDMDDSHLLNTIGLLVEFARNTWAKKLLICKNKVLAYIELIKEVSESSFELASLFEKQLAELDRAMNSENVEIHLKPEFYIMAAEADRRGLSERYTKSIAKEMSKAGVIDSVGIDGIFFEKVAEAREILWERRRRSAYGGTDLVDTWRRVETVKLSDIARFGEVLGVDGISITWDSSDRRNTVKEKSKKEEKVRNSIVENGERDFG